MSTNADAQNDALRELIDNLDAAIIDCQHGRPAFAVELLKITASKMRAALARADAAAPEGAIGWITPEGLDALQREHDGTHATPACYRSPNHTIPIYTRPSAAPAAETGADWQHIANEYADMATNGIQWLRNIREGVSAPAEALGEMEDNLARIRALAPTQDAAHGGRG